jgi:hypothetical protein
MVNVISLRKCRSGRGSPDGTSSGADAVRKKSATHTLAADHIRADHPRTYRTLARLWDDVRSQLGKDSFKEELKEYFRIFRDAQAEKATITPNDGLILCVAAFANAPIGISDILEYLDENKGPELSPPTVYSICEHLRELLCLDRTENVRLDGRGRPRSTYTITLKGYLNLVVAARAVLTARVAGAA